MKTWADVAGIEPRGLSLDRDKGEGPPRCCDRRLVAADALVCYDDVSAGLLSVLVTRFPHLEHAAKIYLCDACSDTLIRERLVTREDRALDLGLPREIVEKMRAHDLSELPRPSS
jgi:hypothetical protein